MPIDLNYLGLTFNNAGWWMGGLGLTFTPAPNAYPHPDLDTANDPLGNLLLVLDPLNDAGVIVTQPSADFQTYLNGRSLLTRRSRPIQAIHADFLKLTVAQYQNILSWLQGSVIVNGVSMAR